MKHLTLGGLREIIARMGNAPDCTEVRFFLRHFDVDVDLDETFGALVATIDSPAEEDAFPRYLGLMLEDTGDMS